MPIEKLRLLALLVWTAFLTPLFVYGVSSLPLFLIQTILAVPLFFPIDLPRIRQHGYWRWYPISSLLLFLASLWMGMRGETSIFLLIIFCLVYEYYGEKRPQAPSRLLGVLSFLVVLSQFRYEHGLWLALGGASYLLVLVFCLICIERDEGLGLGSPIQQIGPTLFHALWVGCVCLTIFWFTPRFSKTLIMSVPNSRANNVSAFSDRVSLNDIATLKLSKRHVMNVTPLNGSFLHSKYLKCKVLDHYEQGIWKSSFRQSKRVLYHRDGGFYRRTLPPDTRFFSYRFNIKPMVGNSIFYFDHLVKIDAAFRLLYVTRTQSEIYLPFRYPSALNYRISCTPEPFFSVSQKDLEVYLQIPENQDYMSTIISEIAGNLAALSPEEIAQAYISFFRQNYQYTLEINNFNVEDPLYEFLVNRREGHCELFASAMVLLLRNSGIPARLVTGFLVPELHPSGEFFYITESNAHAWVEAFVDGSWKTFDPTPSAHFISPNFWDNQLARIERFWDDLILNWTMQTQLNLVKKIGDLVGYSELSGWRFSVSAKRFFFAFCVLVPLFFLFYLRRISRFFARRHGVQQIYIRLERQFDKRFGPKPIGLTWDEYLHDKPIAPEFRAEVMGFLWQYWRVRFGQEECQPDQVRKLRHAYRNLKSQIKKI